ncbi:hypothetical protein SpiGrapes_1973 [Sphaerochaeta pleomorpha str. Grapes]|uniref:Uncharacterized protein n=1 Tax=Sphaerochaeta pleomorpha (strain ATCC BAA-1885 / DSM 22778 / Grapes) TaxID=158190 RepID=G8QQB5_SPHPG|nr:hypothetical protein [Sphaerochaeta pleomorpha]AEV29760.1 hypothetical protein SpiGrapes_1973 [Sphaerochaeta pleomorpha str. Grapes]
MPSKELYTLAKEYQECEIDKVFSESDLFAVEMNDGTPCYVSIVEGALAGYLGKKGLSAYLRLCLEESDSPPLTLAELENSQECYLVTLNNTVEDLEEKEREELEAFSISFGEGALPQFRTKRQYKFPWYLEEADEKDLILLLKAVLYAKTYFSKFGKETKDSSLNPWLESLGLEDVATTEYVPYFQQSGDSFTVSARILPDDAYSIEYPQAELKNEAMVEEFRLMKAKPGKVLYYVTFLFPDPVLSSKSPSPVFPVVEMLYDPQKHDLLDVYMVEDYEEGHVGFVSRLLDYMHQNGKPQAIHCFGERSYPLLSMLGKQIGIRIMQGSFNQELESLKEFFVLQGQEQEIGEENPDHGHVHDHNCEHHPSH